MGGRELSREKEIAVIDKVLLRYGRTQANLLSESARRVIAVEIIDALEAEIPGMIALGELAAIPSPYDLADKEAQFSAPLSQKKVNNDL